MTERHGLTIDLLEDLARRHGIRLSRARLAAALEEVNRLRGHVARLQALPLDDEPPWMPAVDE